MFQLSDKQIQVFKVTFHIIFISIIMVMLLDKTMSLLPDYWLLFLTCDAVEYFVFTILAYLLYYYVLKHHKFWLKTSFIILFISIIAVLAATKSYRIHDEILNNRTFDFFTEFIGKTFLFYALIQIVNRLDFFNKYEKLKNELELAKGQLLRNQLHPHFLFNAFNSLYSMSLSNNPKTSDTILKLSGMMRYLTDDSVHKQVKLEHELKFINEYIAIEKIRFGEQANISLQIEGTPQGISIEPLLLITLVENAFKHGFYTNDSSSFVNITIDVDDKSLLFKVKNSIQDQQHFNQNLRQGKGLENLKNRLQLSYPKKHELLLESENNVYLAQLKINF
ncbi:MULTISPECIES: sensor histidine kinase [unclassified Tenacibaculum]|uniref:sensor histidine kinase n=1 Tax=unclassified Tenacibaculum TaxID=2635139 RepID=UPI001F46C7AE|nr:MULTISPECIES: histidine kinase [unclassified Tenacibaculum]MCF2875757.1 histidine kinase [Tenacibaculum sp. Cn5-1]MCF2935833.1 histidine kinase [Tenacibaculum sp. Cn5-34]MCG7512393.1 histidine kinase [Tenacibaculum sp. Cn5-46]